MHTGDGADALMAEQDEHFPQSQFRVPRGATDVLLIRHGQSAPMPAGNDFPRAPDGQADPELSAEGRQQASQLAARLAAVSIAAIYATSLRRTQQTAEPLAGHCRLPVRIEPDLREIYLGEWEGGEFRRRVAARDPLMHRLHHESTWSVVPGAEPADAFAGRVRAALGRIRDAHPGERVAVVCHGGVIAQALAVATGAAQLAFLQCDNASVSQLILHRELWIVRRFNDTAHLGPAFTAASVPPQ